MKKVKLLFGGKRLSPRGFPFNAQCLLLMHNKLLHVICWQ